MRCWIHLGSQDVSLREGDLSKWTSLLPLPLEYMFLNARGPNCVQNIQAMVLAMFSKDTHLRVRPGAPFFSPGWFQCPPLTLLVEKLMFSKDILVPA